MTSVYQMMLENGIDEIDVADNTFDEMCAWDMPDDDPYDRNYNAAIEYVLKNTEAVKLLNQGSYQWIIADVTGFVENHYDEFKRFTEDCCREVMDYRDRDDNLYVGVRTVTGPRRAGHLPRRRPLPRDPRQSRHPPRRPRGRGDDQGPVGSGSLRVLLVHR